MKRLNNCILFGCLLLLLSQHIFAGCYKTHSLWPSSRIAYMIDENWPEDKLHLAQSVHQAAAYISGTTNLCLVPVTPRDSIYFVAKYGTSGSCSASVGFPGMAHINYFQRMPSFYCNGSLMTTCHEIMHILGIAHEHQRPDRDNYLNILEDNIKTSWKPQYEKRSAAFYSVTPEYDYHSIMHYADHTGNTFFGPTMEATNPTYATFGQRNFLSSLDVETINTMYPDVCDNCGILPKAFDTYTMFRKNKINDGWGKELVPFTFNVTGMIEVVTDVVASFFASADEAILLSPGFEADGYDYEDNEAVVCLEIKECSDDFAYKKEKEIKQQTSIKVYPNPINHQAKIEINLIEQSPITIIVYDISGKEVKRLLNKTSLAIGKHFIDLNTSEFANGTYVCNVQTKSGVQSKKIVLLR